MNIFFEIAQISDMNNKTKLIKQITFFRFTWNGMARTTQRNSKVQDTNNGKTIYTVMRN